MAGQKGPKSPKLKPPQNQPNKQVGRDPSSTQIKVVVLWEKNTQGFKGYLIKHTVR